MEFEKVISANEVLDTETAGQDIPEEAQRVANFDRPHADFETFTTGLTKSLKRVFTTAPRRYDAVHVLLVRWEDDDLGTETEIEDLDKLFRETYHYNTERRTIPSIGAYNSLEYMIVNFRAKYDSPENLLIFYYGGHGVGEGRLNPHNESIWAAKRTSGPTLNWTDMQPILLRTQSDVLFILDCCYASTAGTRDKFHGAKEVLAACSMENGTPGVSDNSFTRQLIGELQQRTKKTQTTWQLHGRMMIRRGRGQLKRTPCHFPLSDKDASRIELRPLRKDAAPVLYGAKGNFNSSLGIPDLTDSLSTMSTEDDVLSPEDEDLIVGNRILLAVNLKDWTKVPLPQDWQRWLRQGAPENIESIIAMHRVYSPQRSAGTSFIEPQDPDSWREGLPTVPGHPDPDRPKRLDEALVWTEGAFDSHSSLLLVSIALPLWTYLPANPAYTFVGFVTSGNRMHSAALSRTNSLSKIKKVAAEFDSQHGWYKWYFVLSLCLLPSFWRILPQKNTESLMLFLALMAFAVGTPFSMLVVSSISREYEGELFSQSNTSFKHH